jgi:hypothetical protein
LEATLTTLDFQGISLVALIITLGLLAYLGLGVWTTAILVQIRKNATDDYRSWSGLSRGASWTITLAWPLIVTIVLLIATFLVSAIIAVIALIVIILLALVVIVLAIFLLSCPFIGMLSLKKILTEFRPTEKFIDSND